MTTETTEQEPTVTVRKADLDHLHWLQTERVSAAYYKMCLAATPAERVEREAILDAALRATAEAVDALFPGGCPTAKWKPPADE